MSAPSRRQVLRVAAIAAVASASGCVRSGAHPAGGMDPFRTRVFHDDFDTMTSIDTSGRGTDQHVWFTDRPFGWGHTPAGDLRVADSVLTIDPGPSSGPGAGVNYSVATVSAASGAGQGWLHGFVEARLRFDPHARGGRGWPAFWMLPKRQIIRGDLQRSVEVDVFEAQPAATGGAFSGLFSGTVHDLELTGAKRQWANLGDNTQRIDIDWSTFHTYGLRWQPGSFEWYVDGRRVQSLSYGPERIPAPNSSRAPRGAYASVDDGPDGLAIILGTGEGHPLEVDWVSVWQ